MNKNEISKEEYIKVKETISKFFMDLDCSIKEIEIEINKYINKKDTEI
ncbi:TPA: hypothetical protein ACXDAZ_003132 [Clostridium botulinum]|nr:hypothetical protein [Clostridium botulinum]APC78718.1 hypothetical protein NPD2_858 [Clostridium botulinum]APU61333.1 hypothetical protein NPD8_3292 [Clostridium botulinum]MCS4447123.1 hypothetical protein [Clostridium botulinum]MCS4457851.1 hypothetical protein [Clostridium botulinum]MCS4460537.1 hypothetical protein [Clostridium botulinum]